MRLRLCRDQLGILHHERLYDVGAEIDGEFGLLVFAFNPANDTIPKLGMTDLHADLPGAVGVLGKITTSNCLVKRI